MMQVVPAAAVPFVPQSEVLLALPKAHILA